MLFLITRIVKRGKCLCLGGILLSSHTVWGSYVQHLGMRTEKCVPAMMEAVNGPRHQHVR